MTTCSDCRYYQVNPEELKVGSCRVNPPTTFALPSPKGIMIQGFDPGVGMDRLACEKFKAREILVN